MKMRVAALATALAVAGIGFAAPAYAGCETQAFAKYCDGPVRPGGTWDRCMEAFGTVNAFGQVQVPTVSRCYPIDPNAFPPTPLGQPQEHIYP
jgi:hypothetical protein